jgi:hypothetical protein
MMKSHTVLLQSTCVHASFLCLLYPHCMPSHPLVISRCSGIKVVLEIRPPKTTAVMIADTETENCLDKVKFTSAEGCTGTWSQQAHMEYTIGWHFYP